MTGDRCRVDVAARHNRLGDVGVMAATQIGIAIPNFWFAIMLQLFFGVYLVDWLGLDGPFFFTAGTRSPGTTSACVTILLAVDVPLVTK